MTMAADDWVAARKPLFGGLAATQHMMSNPLKELEGDSAQITMYVRAHHVFDPEDPESYYTIGGYYRNGGAMVVSCLLASPLAEGLFRRAIVQSGHGSSVVSLDIGQRLVDRLAKLLGIEPTVVGFRSRSWEQVLDAQARIVRPWVVDLRDDKGSTRASALVGSIR
jgi:hypothetical protein